MRILIRSLIVLLSLLFIEGLHAQPGNFNESIIPLQLNKSPLFGNDIVIQDQPDQDQRQVVLCSAFNGWLYATYSYFNTYYNGPAIKILKSVDHGITWSVINDWVDQIYTDVLSLDIVASGDSISNLKLFVSVVFGYLNTNLGQGYVDRFNGITGDWEEVLLENNNCYSIALSTDFMYPATNSNPQSLGVLYSAENIMQNTPDSIIFYSSSDGGMTLENRRIIATSSGNKFHKVALAYGRSFSWNSGRYFAVWEEKDSYTSNTGHIYTAHSNPYFNSIFTAPNELDNLDPPGYGNARNPAIACQYNNIDNDSSNLTEIVLFDNYNSSNQKYNITGYYNLQATNHSNFQKLIVSNFAHNNFQPSINFNLFDSTFMITYYDSTTRKLPFLLNNFNLTNPDSWQWVTTGYNDDSNIFAPYPKVALDLGQKQGANVWAKEGTGGNGIAMFDAQYSTYTGISENKTTDDNQSFRVYPNPCNSSLII